MAMSHEWLFGHTHDHAHTESMDPAREHQHQHDAGLQADVHHSLSGAPSRIRQLVGKLL